VIGRTRWLFFAVAAARMASGLFIGSLAKSQELEKVSLCDLKKAPAAFNHKLIKVTDFVSHGFEDFTLFDPWCPDWQEVWLQYGGKSKSGTIYCCGVSGDRGPRAQELEIEKTTIPLIEDSWFFGFDKSLHRASDSVVHATMVGRFFCWRGDATTTRLSLRAATGIWAAAAC
jgi:hypothetical protein